MQDTSLQHVAISTAGPEWAGSTAFSVSLVRKSLVQWFNSKKVGYHLLMRNLLWLLLCGSLCLTNLSATSIQYQLVSLGGNSYKYQYFFNGAFSANQAINLSFDTSYTLNLSSAVATPGTDWFSFALGPVISGAPSNYIAEALVNNPSLNGTFSVNFTYAAQNGDPALPGSQPFEIDQFVNGNIAGVLASGLTTQQNITDPVVPEPSSLMLSGILLAFLFCLVVRRKANPTNSARA